MSSLMNPGQRLVGRRRPVRRRQRCGRALAALSFAVAGTTVALGSAAAASASRAGPGAAVSTAGRPAAAAGAAHAATGVPSPSGPPGTSAGGTGSPSSGCRTVERNETVYSTARRRGNEIVTRRVERVAAQVCDGDGHAGVVPQVVPDGSPQGRWRLIFDDEFSGRNLDSDYWTTCYPWGCVPDDPSRPAGYIEQEWYDPASCSVSAGALVLTATADAGAKPYASCLVQTYGKETFKYGYFEARMLLPAEVDAWPAFWLVGTSDGNEEIDVLESYLGNDQVTQNFHWDGGAEGNMVVLPWATTGWNTYGVDWEPGSITWYVDGTEVWHVSGSRVFSKDAFLILNLAIDSIEPSPSVPATMKVDYVRVWRHASASASSTAPGGPPASTSSTSSTSTTSTSTSTSTTSTTSTVPRSPTTS
jgi:beta-glucanase (GH16 family)